MSEFIVFDERGDWQPIVLPVGINLSLMEVLKASGYSIAATCGGMALCGTCHVAVERGAEKLPPAGEMEQQMLDNLPNAGVHSRLSCQLRLTHQFNGMIFRILGDDG